MRNSAVHLDRNLLLSLLDNIGADLASQGVQAEIAVFGGAAMILAFPDAGGETAARRESTRDVDVVFLEPEDASEAVASAADKAGVRQGLETGWLNDAVSMFASDRGAFAYFGEFPRPSSGENVSAGPEHNGGLRVTLASPQYIFAMKMLAMRSSLESNDPKDVWNLIAPCDIDSVESAERIVARFYPGEVLPERTKAIFSDLLEARAAGRDYDPMLGW